MHPDSRVPLICGGLLTALLIYFYPAFLPTPLLEPDEGLHATISQEMLEHGEWIVPTFRGEPFLDKPILYFWAQMVSLKAFGMNEFAVRLPGLMFGLLGALSTGLLAGRLFGSRVGSFACLMSMTTLIPLSLAQAAVHDVALVPWTNLALLCLWEMERAVLPRRRYQWLAGAACMFALAILTKALIGVAVIGVGYGLFLICSRTISIGSCIRLGMAIAAGAVLASPWFIAMEFRITGYLYYYFVERHVMGFATATQKHSSASWYYYLPYLTLGAMPWIWYVVPLLRDEWKLRTKQSPMLPQMVMLLSWLIGGLFFLTVAKSKLVPYALPLFPAIAILCAVSWHRYVSGRMTDVSAKWFLNMVRSAGLGGMLAPFCGMFVCQVILGTTWPLVVWFAAAILSVGSAASVLAFERKRFNQSASLVAVWVAGAACLVMTFPVPMFAESHSERDLAQWINRQGVIPEHLILIGEKPASFIFYLSKSLRSELRSTQVEAIYLDELRSRKQLLPGTVLAVTSSNLRKADSNHQVIPGTLIETVGQFHLFRNDGPLSSVVQVAGRSE
ncbi:MAG: glycosyltransferase family 39 protein [Rhodopirellula sp.]|nr:glycosyltransferase family 39 protein [Rhodopirellula sp.]